MAQSAITVTPPNPTPPTNYGSGIANTPKAGLQTMPPNLDYAATVYNDPWHPGATNPTQPASNNPSGATTSTAPPFLDDGIEATPNPPRSLNEAVTPPAYGTFSAPNSGAAHEGAGTEVVVTQTYPTTVFTPAGPLKTFSDMGNYVGGDKSINAAHASSLSPATNPALTSATPGNTAAGAGNTTLAVVGTNLTKQSVVWYGGVAYPTTWNSATSLSVAAVPKKATAGNIPVYVITGGAVITNTVNAAYV